jgi:hypothetical protein
LARGSQVMVLVLRHLSGQAGAGRLNEVHLYRLGLSLADQFVSDILL